MLSGTVPFFCTSEHTEAYGRSCSSTVPMWSSAWEPYSTTNHDPVLCRGLGHWLATARREVRDRSRSSPYPSIRRLQWPCGDRQQPHCPCELLWRRAMESTYLGRSCRSLPAACRRRGAGSTTSQILKVHFSREPSKLLTSGFHGSTRAARARVIPARSRGVAQPSAGALCTLAEDGTRSQ